MLHVQRCGADTVRLPPGSLRLAGAPVCTGLPDPMHLLQWPVVAGSVAAAACVGAAFDARRKSRLPALCYQRTAVNEAIMEACPSLGSFYSACPFLSNCHMETIFAALFRRDPGVMYYRRCVIMQDGAAIAVDYELLGPGEELPVDAPVLLLLPGLTGGSHDVYVQHMVQQARRRGMRAVVFNGRGTSDSPVTTPQFYSASYTEDTRRVANFLREQYPHSTLLAAGWSLGANILLRYLGEEGADGNKPHFAAAASLCNPFNLPISNANFEKGFNRFYDRRLAQSLSTIFRRHLPLFLNRGGELNPELAVNCNTIREFDDAVTRVAFGWPSVDAYYEGSSSSLSLPHIRLPLLCVQGKCRLKAAHWRVQAGDDPIAPYEAIPFEALEANEHCILSVTPAGGHLGWVSPSDPRGAPSVHESVVDFFAAVLAAQPSSTTNGIAQPEPQPILIGKQSAEDLCDSVR